MTQQSHLPTLFAATLSLWLGFAASLPTAVKSQPGLTTKVLHQGELLAEVNFKPKVDGMPDLTNP